MFEKALQEARKRFLAGKLNGVASLIDYLQTLEGAGCTISSLKLELPVGIIPTKPLPAELEYISKCFSAFSQDALSAFDQSCYAAVLLQKEAAPRAAAL